LDEAACQAVWKLTEREGDVLTAVKATPYIVNFEMVDTNRDGKISEGNSPRAAMVVGSYKPRK
jgi:hypothetical protein